MIEPVLFGVLTPFLIAMLAAFLLLRALPRLPLGIAMGVALLIGLVLLEGFPPIPPLASKQKIVMGLGALVLIFLLADLFSLERGPEHAGGLAASLLLIGWLGWKRLVRFDSIEAWGVLVATALCASGIGWFLSRRDAHAGSVTAAPLILASALALAAVAGIGGSASLALFASALAGSVGGLALTGFIVAQTRAHVPSLGTTGIWISSAFLGALAASLLYFVPDTSRLALAGIVGVPLSGVLADRIPLPERRRALLRPILLFAVALGAAGLVFGLAVWSDGELLVDEPSPAYDSPVRS